MVKALDLEGSEDPAKRIETDMVSSSIEEKTAANFVTQSSLRFFEILNLPTEVLAVDPQKWEGRVDYQKGLQFVRTMKVVNDCAEGGLDLMRTYNGILTKNEDQKQFLLQLVEEHRGKFPNASKTTASGYHPNC